MTLRRGILLLNNDFILDSLFCEWGYIVNLDQERIEFYKGVVRLEDRCEGRYAAHVPPTRTEIPYRACTLADKCPLTAEGAQTFLEAMIKWDGKKR